ncbi:hypothetical protein EDB83DRAFT_2606447 [Lactarius deliciosus]|nr:hypothetical protein EDB83DRAFT_2606447 [Lactarius deliciosus]
MLLSHRPKRADVILFKELLGHLGHKHNTTHEGFLGRNPRTRGVFTIASSITVPSPVRQAQVNTFSLISHPAPTPPVFNNTITISPPPLLSSSLACRPVPAPLTSLSYTLPHSSLLSLTGIPSCPSSSPLAEESAFCHALFLDPRLLHHIDPYHYPHHFLLLLSTSLLSFCCRPPPQSSPPQRIQRAQMIANASRNHATPLSSRTTPPSLHSFKPTFSPLKPSTKSLEEAWLGTVKISTPPFAIDLDTFPPLSSLEPSPLIAMDCHRHQSPSQDTSQPPYAGRASSRLVLSLSFKHPVSVAPPISL